MTGEERSKGGDVRGWETGRRRSKGYAAVWCPEFALQSVLPRAHARLEPVALVDEARRQSVVLVCNERAARGGVESGMRTVQALARCPDLLLERPSPAAEALAAGRLLKAVRDWVPGVEESGGGWLVADLSSTPEAAWVEGAARLRGRLYDEGLEVVVGIGETPSLAGVAACAARWEGRGVLRLSPQDRQAQLDRLPVEVAGMGVELQARLRLWGVVSLGAFARLAREEVAARLGEVGVAWWLRLSGGRRRPLCLVAEEERFEAGIEFEESLRERGPLLGAAERLIKDLAARAERSGLAVAAVHLFLFFADGSRHAKRLDLPESRLCCEVLFRLVVGHLEGVAAKAAVEELRLRLEMVASPPSPRSLFGGGLRHPARFEETLKRLQRLVGAGGVGSPRMADSHRPGAFEVVPLAAELRERGSAGGPPLCGLPLRRFPPGEAVEVRRDAAGRPAEVRSRRASGLVEASLGPWLCDGEWWEAARYWSRAEWELRLRGGAWFRLAEEDERWTWVGRYD